MTRRLELDSLGDPDYWQSVSTEGELQVTFIIPTGRARDCPNTNLALSSDALYLPEIALALDRLARRAGLELDARSMFDIDFFESADRDPATENLIISGSTNVNAVTRQLLDNATVPARPYKAGFISTSHTFQIASARDEDLDDPSYNMNDSPNIGALTLFDSPWADDRIVVLCAGVLPVGTIASLQLLLDYLKGKGHGNNRLNADEPVKVFEGIPRQYRNVRLKPLHVCRPQMELVNVVRPDIKE
jgi:hypothetical protein